jgi:hypothetical protein
VAAVTILHGDWPPERLRQAAFRYEVLRRIPPYLHQKIWIHTLNHSSFDEIVDRVGAAIERYPDELLSEIVCFVLDNTKLKGE